MEFFINKNSTLPVLKLELIRDGRNDFHKFFELIRLMLTFSSLPLSRTAQECSIRSGWKSHFAVQLSTAKGKKTKDLRS